MKKKTILNSGLVLNLNIYQSFQSVQLLMLHKCVIYRCYSISNPYAVGCLGSNPVSSSSSNPTKNNTASAVFSFAFHDKATSGNSYKKFSNKEIKPQK